MTKLLTLVGAMLLAAGCTGYGEAQMRAYNESQLNAKLWEHQKAGTDGDLLKACTLAGQIAAGYGELGSPNEAAWTVTRNAECQAAKDSIYPSPH